MNKKEGCKLHVSAVQSLIDICSAAHDLEEDIFIDTGNLIPLFRNAYRTLDKLEQAGMVKFEEPRVYAKILKQDARGSAR